MGTNGDIPQNQPWTAHFFAIRILGYHFTSRLTATLNLCLIYFKITWALPILLESMHKKFEINRTKIKGCCQSGRKVVTKIHNSKSDLPLVLLVLPINVKKPIITIQGVLDGPMVVFMDENVIIHTNMTTNAVSNHKKWDSGLLLLKHLNCSSDLDSPQCAWSKTTWERNYTAYIPGGDIFSITLWSS